jgi:hypothetical protein
MSTQWSSAMPTEERWYNASTERNPRTLRFWMGPVLGWSAPVHVDDLDLHGAAAKSLPGESQSPEVEWREPNLGDAPCLCPQGKCLASKEGKRIGRVSTISDLHCQRHDPSTGLPIGLPPGESVAFDDDDRALAATVEAFNVFTKHGVTIEQGRLFVECLNVFRSPSTLR